MNDFPFPQEKPLSYCEPLLKFRKGSEWTQLRITILVKAREATLAVDFAGVAGLEPATLKLVSRLSMTFSLPKEANYSYVFLTH